MKVKASKTILKATKRLNGYFLIQKILCCGILNYKGISNQTTEQKFVKSSKELNNNNFGTIKYSEIN